MADKHHVVAMSQLDFSFMITFDSTTCNESIGGGGHSGAAQRGGKTSRKIFLAERQVRLDFEAQFLPSVFLLDDWLVFPHENENELIWFDKTGQRSEKCTRAANFPSLFTANRLYFCQHVHRQCTLLYLCRCNLVAGHKSGREEKKRGTIAHLIMHVYFRKLCNIHP